MTAYHYRQSARSACRESDVSQSVERNQLSSLPSPRARSKKDNLPPNLQRGSERTDLSGTMDRLHWNGGPLVFGLGACLMWNIHLTMHGATASSENDRQRVVSATHEDGLPKHGRKHAKPKTDNTQRKRRCFTLSRQMQQ